MVCKLCGGRFRHGRLLREREDVNGEGAWFTYLRYVCPHCGEALPGDGCCG